MLEDMKTSPSCAIIIPHYNDPERLGKCLTAVFDQIGEDLRDDVDVIVVDNASPVDLTETKTRFPLARFLVEHQRGAAAARNCGVEDASAETIMFLDSDCIPAEGWLEIGMKLFGSTDIIGGRVQTFDETDPPRSGAEGFETVFAFNQRKYIEKEGFSVTANLITTKTIFSKVGPFRAGVSEDLDWCQRAVGLGYKIVYADDFCVFHPTRQNWADLKKKWARLTEESYDLFVKNGGKRLAWALRAGLVLVSPFPHSAKVIASDSLDGAKERLRAITTLFRIRIWRAGYMLRVMGRSN